MHGADEVEVEVEPEPDPEVEPEPDPELEPGEFGRPRVGNWYTGPTEGTTAVTPATPAAGRFVCISVHGTGTGGRTPGAAVPWERFDSLPARTRERLVASPACAIEAPENYGHAVVETLRAFVRPYDEGRARDAFERHRGAPSPARTVHAELGGDTDDARDLSDVPAEPRADVDDLPDVETTDVVPGRLYLSRTGDVSVYGAGSDASLRPNVRISPPRTEAIPLDERRLVPCDRSRAVRAAAERTDGFWVQGHPSSACETVRLARAFLDLAGE
jgi:hypothetical protein